MKRWQQWVRELWKGARQRRSELFESARLKLTVFYLAILLAFSLTLTLSVRAVAQHEFERAGVGARSMVERLLYSLYSVPPHSPALFHDYQQDQQDAISRRLNRDIMLINFAALVVGGLLSYWYAGRALRPIEEAHEAQARFASDASHELRTPLANMRLENEVFLRQKQFDEGEARALLASNLEEVQRLETLANSLLALTHYESASLDIQPVAVRMVVDTAIEQTKKGAASKHVHIEQEVPPAHILGDAQSLPQLLAIILDNAYKYGPEKGVVTIQGEVQGSLYRLSVRDQGPGIAEDDSPHIFERLYRGDKARLHSGGYGLGLSLAKEIAAANNADIAATNHPEGGALFTVSLRLA